MEKPRRNYIRRKRCFNDCTNCIAKTLRIIMEAKSETFTEASLNQLAISHASQIEAACWTPRSKMTDEDYHAITTAKTVELCSAILKKSLKNLDQTKLKFLVLITHPELASLLKPPVRPVQQPVVAFARAETELALPDPYIESLDFEYTRGLPQLDDLKGEFGFLEHLSL